MDDTSALRWVLIICGVALLGGLLLFGNPNRKPKTRKPKRRKPNRRKAAKAPKTKKTKKAPRSEPVLTDGDEPSRFDDPNFSAAPRVEPTLEPDQAELPMGDNDTPQVELDTTPKAPPPEPPEKVIVLYLRARDNRTIAGVELLDAALKSGMEFGEMDIFHRNIEGQGRALFSMANLEEPGTFDPNGWPTFETRGMTLFMGLPGPMPTLDAGDALVATAKRISELLHLDVLDSERQVFTRQREGELREELRTFEREQQPEG